MYARWKLTTLTLVIAGRGAALGWLTATGGFGAEPLTAAQAKAEEKSPYMLDRKTLPIPEPNYPHSTVLDARDAKAPPRFQGKPPDGAPNVLIVLIDDM